MRTMFIDRLNTTLKDDENGPSPVMLTVVFTVSQTMEKVIFVEVHSTLIDLKQLAISALAVSRMKF